MNGSTHKIKKIADLIGFLAVIIGLYKVGESIYLNDMDSFFSRSLNTLLILAGLWLHNKFHSKLSEKEDDE